MTNVLNDITLAGGTAQQQSVQPTAGGTILEAETAQNAGGTIQAAISGFTGTGYVALNTAGGKINWTYMAPVSGRYLVEFRYSINTGTIPITLSINGTAVDQTLSFWTTGTTWQTETRYVILNAGTNTISITASALGTAVDHVNIVPLATTGLLGSLAVSAPNEFKIKNGILCADILLKAPSEVCVSIFDIRGCLIKQVVSPFHQAGLFPVAINVKNIPRGFYIAKLSYNQREFVKKVSLEH
jgi:hypothetical protein